MASVDRSREAIEPLRSNRDLLVPCMLPDQTSRPLECVGTPHQTSLRRRRPASRSHGVPRESLFTSWGLDTHVPVIAFAIHHGHRIRPDIRADLGLSSSERKREEDPYTGDIARAVQARVVVNRSRFEIDLNRPPTSAVYDKPSDAWGLQVWRQPLPPARKRDSVLEYRDFYTAVYAILAEFERRFGRFLVLDIHSYNHRREGPDAPASPAEGNPEVNLGTGSLDRERWAPLVDQFISELVTPQLGYGPLDVRENVKFQGGQLVTWVHQNFPASACALALEFKKTFMDEWTGTVDRPHLRMLRARLHTATLAALPKLAQIE